MNHEAVLTIEPASDETRASRPGARFALVQHYMGRSVTLTTDDQCPNGIGAAACAYAQATGAAYMSRVPS